ncbi:MAG: hypothetical protein E3K40_05295 [Candidatus Brocadia sp.]|nr:hypothetical protein [Candidatus Brocadia sp.]MDG6026123.1 hypothetical protein [Candidatus Brocadia sp.]
MNQGYVVGDKGTILHTVDGGKTWNSQTSGTGADLTAVQFMNVNQGWAIGGGGTILYTVDGGKEWASQTSGTKAMLYAMQFMDANQGWAVGNGGTIIHTVDGGKTWNPQTSGTNEWLTTVLFLDENQGWVAGDGGTILHTVDGGKIWNSQTSGVGVGLTDVEFLDENQGWSVGFDGKILHTVDGGKTWNPQTSGTTEWLTDVEFVDENQGWAVGSEGTILHTVDGGKTWNSQTSGMKEWLTAVQFLDVNQGWAVGFKGTILYTVDGGKTWNPQTSETDVGFDAVQFLDVNQGWVVGSEGTILHTVDGGKTWNPKTSGTKMRLSAVQLLDENQGWAAGDGGTILHTVDEGKMWNSQASGTEEDLTAVQFLDVNQGWAVSDRGTILHTVDGGKTWNPQTSGTTECLTAVQFLDVNQGWVVGDGGTILHTADGGKTWRQRVLPYKKYPAPWYYFVLFVVVALVSQSVRKLRPITERPTIANMLISDKPLEASDPDAMDFRRIALGLSRFLRNENTQPPLTIAITGAWGTGKSSLMNLLKTDLSRYGFRPVWFNAWHHQNEEHLLAALLENISIQAIPQWWRATGFFFRMKLLMIRGWRKWVLVLIMMLLFSGSLGYFIKEPSRFSNVEGSIKKLKAITIDKVFPKEENNSPSKKTLNSQNSQGSSPITILITSVLSGMSLLYAGWRGFKAFGVNPASLMTSMVGSTRIKDLEVQAGFRHKFAMEFQDVTRALNPRTILILIDDLDRCKPENVLVILEAINFLVTSGDCFIVIGMDRDRVERCVGLGFKDVAEELMEDIEEKDKIHKGEASNIQDATNNANKDDGRRRRADFAVHYLEKLINIEVPIPRPTPDQSRRLLLSKDTDEQKIRRRYERVRNSFTLAGKYFVGMAVMGIVLCAFWCGYSMEKTDTNSNKTANSAASKPVTVVTDALKRPESTSIPTPTMDKKEEREMGRVINPDMEKASYLRYLWAALIFFPVGYWVFSRRSGIVIKDSDDFTNALDIWKKVIFMKNLTPRSVKRFINRIRYFAMCLRTQEEGLTLWERFLYWWAGRGVTQKGKSASETSREKTEQLDQGNMAEPILVAMSAIHHVNPALVEQDGLLPTGAYKAHEISKEMRDAIDDALKAHAEKYSSLRDDWEMYRHQFIAISKGIRIH